MEDEEHETQKWNVLPSTEGSIGLREACKEYGNRYVAELKEVRRAKV